MLIEIILTRFRNARNLRRRKKQVKEIRKFMVQCCGKDAAVIYSATDEQILQLQEDILKTAVLSLRGLADAAMKLGVTMRAAGVSSQEVSDAAKRLCPNRHTVKLREEAGVDDLELRTTGDPEFPSFRRYIDVELGEIYVVEEKFICDYCREQKTVMHRDEDNQNLCVECCADLDDMCDEQIAQIEQSAKDFPDQ